MNQRFVLFIAVLSASLAVTSCGKRAKDAEKEALQTSTPSQEKEFEEATRAIWIAVVAKDAVRSRELLNTHRDLNLNYVYQTGETLLTVAVKNNDLEMIDLLLEKNVDTEKSNVRGDNPLMIAAREGHLGLVQRFTGMYNAKYKTKENPATPQVLNQKNLDSDTALLLALKHRHEAIALFMINQGVNADITDRDNRNALHLSRNLNLEKVYELLKSKRDAEDGTLSREDFLVLLRGADVATLQAVVEKTPHVLKEYADENLLVQVLQNQPTDTAVGMIQLLLDKQVSEDGPEFSKTTPLIESIKLNKLYFMNLFLQAGADRNKRDAEEKSPLVWAIETNNQLAVKKLLAYAAITSYSLIRDGRRITFRACDVAKATKKKLDGAEERRNMDEIMKLLDCGINPFN